MATKTNRPAAALNDDVDPSSWLRRRSSRRPRLRRLWLHGVVQRRGKIFTGNFWAAVLAVSVAALVCAPRRPLPLALINLTPSEPMGLYVRDDRAPAVGTVVAFKPPPAAKAYEDRRGERLTTFLKTVAAATGDRVCVADHQLQINGAVRGRLARRDRVGSSLPQWRGCRRLAAGELFVFSNRVPNSFDSRYFGPVDRSAVAGVFHPAVLLRGGGR